MKPRRRQPEVVLRNGKPAAVILDIDKYRERLEKLVVLLSKPYPHNLCAHAEKSAGLITLE